MLYVDQFAGTGDADWYTGIVNTLDFFTQKYSQDTAFAEKVDQSVLRILTAKYKLYPNFNLDQVLPAAVGSPNTATANLDYSVAQEAVTLIDPSAAELPAILPDPPSRSDRIVFLMDSRKVRMCTTCDEESIPAVNSFQKAVLNSFGPGAANQVVSARLSSYSFQHILDWMNDINPPENLATDVRNANWIVVGVQNLDTNLPSSYAFKRLLSEKPDLFRNKKVIVFALNAPYYLDATDISKISAYYGVFGKTQNCFNVASLVLFQEFTPHGASPVSIPGVGYDLIEATSPDPAQIINLMLDLPETPLPTPSEPEITRTPEKLPEFSIGDTFPVRTGVIVDHNGHPVPDGTVARFIITGGSDVAGTQQIEATTINGIARTSFRIATKGLMQIWGCFRTCSNFIHPPIGCSTGCGRGCRSCCTHRNPHLHCRTYQHLSGVAFTYIYPCEFREFNKTGFWHLVAVCFGHQPGYFSGSAWVIACSLLVGGCDGRSALYLVESLVIYILPADYRVARAGSC